MKAREIKETESHSKENQNITLPTMEEFINLLKSDHPLAATAMANGYTVYTKYSRSC